MGKRRGGEEGGGTGGGTYALARRSGRRDVRDWVPRFHVVREGAKEVDRGEGDGAFRVEGEFRHGGVERHEGGLGEASRRALWAADRHFGDDSARGGRWVRM